MTTENTELESYKTVIESFRPKNYVAPKKTTRKLHRIRSVIETLDRLFNHNSKASAYLLLTGLFLVFVWVGAR